MKALGMLQKWNNGNYPSKQEISEAIAELKALENRSCESCKTKNCSVKRILVEKEEISTDYFNCNDWESKNETN